MENQTENDIDNNLEAGVIQLLQMPDLKTS